MRVSLWGLKIISWLSKSIVFDKGPYHNDPKKASKIIKNLLAGMDVDLASNATRTADLPIIKAHDSIWRRLVESSPKGVQRRYTEGMRGYTEGIMAEVTHCSNASLPSLSETLENRRRTIVTLPSFALLEYGCFRLIS